MSAFGNFFWRASLGALLLIGLIVVVVPSVSAQEVEPADTPVHITYLPAVIVPTATADASEAGSIPLSVGSGEVGATQWTPNPWGCLGYADHPHESQNNPGLGWVQAKSRIRCASGPPSYVIWRIEQRLERWSFWFGWHTVSGPKTSECPSGAGSAECWMSEMRAHINYDCASGSTAKYRTKNFYSLHDLGTTYTGYGQSAEIEVTCS